jgi:D-amino-acid dehydrogenase
MAQSVIVIGAGPIGLLSALALARRGCEVTVVDAGALGSGGARWNAGEVVPRDVDPVSNVGFLRKGLTGLVAPRREPSLTIDLGDVVTQAGFFAQFAWKSRPSQYLSGQKALVALAHNTYDLLADLGQAGVDVRPQGTQFLYVFGSPATASARRDEDVAKADTTGMPVPEPMLGHDELKDREPQLSAAAAAGYLQEGHRYLDPQRFTESVIAVLKRSSATLIERAPVRSLEVGTGHVVVRTPNRRLAADHVVIAAGVRSAELARTLGARLLLENGRGYSLRTNLALANRNTLLHFNDVHVVASPFDDEVQLAGQMNFSRRHIEPDVFHTRILDAAARYLPAVVEAGVHDSGQGVRPMTPDGLPYLGRIAPRVSVAAGHNMIGFTLAPSTAEIVAGLVTDPTAVVDDAFNPFRFSGKFGGLLR